MPESTKSDRSPSVSKIKKFFSKGKHSSSSSNSSFNEDLSMLSQSSTLAGRKSKRLSTNINTSSSNINGLKGSSKSAPMLSPEDNSNIIAHSSTRNSLNLPNISPVRSSTPGRHKLTETSDGEFTDKIKPFHNPLKFLVPDSENTHLGTTTLSAKVSRTVEDAYGDQLGESEEGYIVNDGNSITNSHLSIANSKHTNPENGETNNEEDHEEKRGLLSAIISTLHFKSQTDLNETQAAPEIDENLDSADSINSQQVKILDGDINNISKLSETQEAENISDSPLQSVSFVPIKESLLNSFGKGNLSLDNFPKPENGIVSSSSNTTNTNGNNIQIATPILQKSPTTRFTSMTGNPLPERNGHNGTMGNLAMASSKSSSNITEIIHNNSLAMSHNNKSDSDLQRKSVTLAQDSTNSQLPNLSSNDGLVSVKRSSLKHEGSPDYFTTETTNAKTVTNDAELSFTQRRRRRNTGEKSHNGISRILSRDTVFSSDSPVENDDADATAANSIANTVGSVDYRKTERALELYKRLGTKPQSDKQFELFHQCFPSLPRDELLIDVYVCAFRKKELLIQGKLFLTEKNIGFYSNIMSIVTSFILPFNKVLDIVKKKTIIFKNSIEFQTLHNKYFFASFMARDAAYDTICKTWSLYGSSSFSDTVKMTQEDDEVDDPTSDSDVDDEYEPNTTASKSMKRSTSVLSNADAKSQKRKDTVTEMDAIDHSSDVNVGTSEDSYDDDEGDVSVSDEEQMVKEGAAGGEGTDSGANPTSFGDIPLVGPLVHEPTSNGYEPIAIDTKIADEIIPAPLGAVYNLLFGDDVTFAKNLLTAQKNFNISEIPKLDEEKKRSFSYVKPLGGPVGPKQTRCNIVEQIIKSDFDSCVQALQTSDTPDVPKGNIFKVQTKIFLSWGKNNDTRLYVATCILWSGSSFIKGAVEKGAIGGQKESIGVMVDELKKRIASSGGKLGGGSSKSSRPKNKRRKNKKSHGEDNEHTTVAPVVPEQPSQVDSSGSSGYINSFLSSINDVLPSPFTVQNVTFFILLVWFIHDKILLPSNNSRGLTKNDRSGNGSLSSGYEDNRYLYNSHLLQNSGALVNSEYDVWEWINDRSSVSRRREKVIKEAAKTDSDIVGKLKDQQILEMIDILEKRRKNLESLLEGHT